ncbi:methyltransferase domain-containing protein [Urbifossiella limnaea]|uniref:Ubiquinone/menaquinone biosynthesis C-methyltransferase UbiE n=1 Tax=Urbifossiella limnaea TaxID=2528023 RepID=A0A517Y1M9_9BACT|nr:methyltransferase domain-containing protein [Urbifossiella limnaea]QDU23671.1 Ubiquinone/menaquinone biosynthesis C-methyltransferase UbiE [Urbifossiella limnaea]
MTRRRIILSAALFAAACTAFAQERSVAPGINDPFKEPDVKGFQTKFEGESREVYVAREKVVAAVGLRPGMVVADVGAGTGLFTRLFANAVGPTGQVFAVDIAPKFLEHVQKTSREAGLRNVTPVLCAADSVDLPPASVDVAFVCDTYHHFEFPERTLASLHRAVRPGGKLVVIDFVREPGKSTDWVLKHVRAGQGVFEREIASAGFVKEGEVKDVLKENYLVVFTRAKDAAPAPPGRPASLTPAIPGYGAVVPLPGAAEPPVKGTKVVFDVTAAGKDPAKPPPGLERAATLLNLAVASGLKASDLEVVIVLHGDAAAVALTDPAYRVAVGHPHPAEKLLGSLTGNGVRVLVCGQSLARKGYDPATVRPGVTVAASAVTAVVNLQARGFAYVPAH